MDLTARDFKTQFVFPNVIWKTQLSNVDNENIKHYAIDLMAKSEGRKVSNVLGWQSNNLVNNTENNEIIKLIDQLEFALTDISASVGLPLGVIDNLWINLNGRNSYNLPHDHHGSYLSGVYYIDSTSEQGNIIFERTDSAEYFIPQYSDQTHYTKFTETYPADTGNLYVFGSVPLFFLSVINFPYF